MNETSAMSEKEILNDFKENYGIVRKLLDEDSKNDPENEPYLSKYKAKGILNNMRESLSALRPLCDDPESKLDKLKIDAMLGAVLLNIGIVDMDTEELSSSEKVLMEAADLLTPNAIQPEIVNTIINVFNNLGILWSNRNEYEKAKMCLINASGLYISFKSTLQMPQPIEQTLSNDCDNVASNIKIFERAHTLTLYYLAQVYGSLKKNLKSAIYCHETLRRQLQYIDYEPIDWALNSATLSQFFAENNGFVQSKHHLAAASTILKSYESTLTPPDTEDEVFLAKMEVFRHRSADVARCWAKYCLLLMSASRTRLMDDNEADKLEDTIKDVSNLKVEDDEEISEEDIKNLIFPDLDVTKYEETIGHTYLLTYDDARKVFLCCQNWLNKAKEYYKLETLASDYIKIVQDSSQAYAYLAFFEESDERRAKMHKRRADMLEELIKEINPTYYLQYCRQLWYELGQVYWDILDIKLDKLNQNKEPPNPSMLQKINHLCEKSIENYEYFLNSIKDKNGRVPQKLEVEIIRPVISAYAYIGRNSMKRIAVDKATQLSHVKTSYDAYQAVVDICTNDEAAAVLMKEEFSLCQEMVKILPIKIKKLESDLLA